MHPSPHGSLVRHQDMNSKENQRSVVQGSQGKHWGKKNMVWNVGREGEGIVGEVSRVEMKRRSKLPKIFFVAKTTTAENQIDLGWNIWYQSNSLPGSKNFVLVQKWILRKIKVNYNTYNKSTYENIYWCFCWRALARQLPILYNSEKKAKSVRCKIEDMRSRLCYLYPGIPGCLWMHVEISIDFKQ